MAIVTGDIIGKRYKILGRLDYGTLADIRVAHDALLDRTVSIKLAYNYGYGELKVEYANGLFLKEARLVASME